MPDLIGSSTLNVESILDVEMFRDSARRAFSDDQSSAWTAIGGALDIVAAVDSLISVAGAALAGDAVAATSLRNRLGWRLTALQPPSDRAGARSTMHPDALGVLLAGAIWSADSPEQARVLLDAALRIVEPIAVAGALVADATRGVDMSLQEVRLDHLVRGVALARHLLEMPDDGPPLGPDDGPIGPFEPGPVESPWDQLPLLPRDMDYISPGACVFEAAHHVGILQLQGPRYSITSIEPGSVCRPTKQPVKGGSNTMTIRGSGFGSGGTVAFHSVDAPGAFIEVQATTWSADTISVDVPLDAASGPVELRVKFGEFQMCGRTFDLFELPDQLMAFDAESAAYDLTVEGRHSPAVFTSASTVTVAWAASQSPTTRVTINATVTDVATGTLVMAAKAIHQSTGGGTGYFDYTLPASDVPQTVLFELLVFNGCAHGHDYLSAAFTVAPAVSLKVYSMEVTQGYQHHPGGLQQSTSAQAFPPDQLVPTIAGKDTIVRAYVGVQGSIALDPTLPGVTGVLLVDGTPLMPISATVTARPTVTRRPIDSTLNFRIPAAWCTGTRTLVLRVAGIDGAGRPVSTTRTESWTWTQAHALKVRWTRIVDKRNPPLPTVTDAEALSLLRCAFTYLPSPATDLAPAVVAFMETDKDPRDHSINYAAAAAEFLGLGKPRRDG